MASSPSANSSLVRFLKLSRSEQYSLAKAAGLLAGARTGLARRDISNILNDLQRSPAGTPCSRDQMELISWAIGTAAHRVPWRADCLIQAMAASRWLRQLQAPWQFHIGVRREPDGQLAAHAWLAVGRKIVTGHLDDLDTYKPITTDDFSNMNVRLKG